MSVDLEKGSKHTPINLKKEEPHKKVSLTKVAVSSGAAAGAPVNSGKTAAASGKTAGKSGGRKWIAVAAALVLVIGAAAAVKVIQSDRSDTSAGTAPAETDTGSNPPSTASTSAAGASGNGTSDAGGEDAVDTSAGAGSAAGDTAAAGGDTSVSGANEDSGTPASEAAGDGPAASAGSAAGAAEAAGGKIGRYEVIVSNLSWSEAFDDCLKRGGKLCTVDSAEENDAVISALRQADFHGTVYLGGMRNADSKEYHWVDEDKQMLEEVINGDGYKNFWFRGEPSYTDGAGREERYMTILYNKESGWVWNDVCENIVALSPGYYSGRVAYICEYN